MKTKCGRDTNYSKETIQRTIRNRSNPVGVSTGIRKHIIAYTLASVRALLLFHTYHKYIKILYLPMPLCFASETSDGKMTHS